MGQPLGLDSVAVRHTILVVKESCGGGGDHGRSDCTISLNMRFLSLR